MNSRKLITFFVFLMVLTGGCVKEGGDAEKEGSIPQSSNVPLGLTILPKGDISQWTDQAFTEAFQKGGEAGVSLVIWRNQWGDIETSRGQYKWNDLDYQFLKTEQQGLEYSLVIEVIHTNGLGRYPQDVTFTTFDDPEFKDAFKSFIRELLQRYDGKIEYLWIGNEVDCYLHDHPDQTTSFLSFYREVEDEIKSVDPDITVGIVGAYHIARNNDDMDLLRDLAEEGDAVALTLYMEDDRANPDVSDTQEYFDQMLSEFPGKRIAIIETAWSSAGPKGSEEKQSEFVRELARVAAKHEDRFIFLSWFILYDFSDQVNRDIASSFGLPLDIEWGRQFLDWQGSLGLLNKDGTEKQAWKTWKEHMLKEATPRN